MLVAAAIDVAEDVIGVAQNIGMEVVAAEPVTAGFQVWEGRYGDCRLQAVACMHIHWPPVQAVEDHAEVPEKMVCAQHFLMMGAILFAVVVYVVVVHGREDRWRWVEMPRDGA